MYKQVYLMSRDNFNSWFKTCWISEKMAIVGKFLRITHDNKNWQVLEVYPETRNFDQIRNIKNQLKDYNSYKPKSWDDTPIFGREE